MVTMIKVMVLCGLLLGEVMTENEFNWTSTPDTVYVCLGGEARFDWTYDEAEYGDKVRTIYWRFMETGDTVIAYHFTSPPNSGEVVPYNEDVYKDRAYVMRTEGRGAANAGLILRDVRKSDEGEYRVELGGIREADAQATLRVYSEEDLKPRIILDNEDIGWSETLHIKRNAKGVVAVATVDSLPADIFFDIEDQDSSSCQQKTFCSDTLTNKAIGSTLTVNITIDYGFCRAYELSFIIKREMMNPVTASNIHVLTTSDIHVSDHVGKATSDKNNTGLIVGMILFVLIILGAIGIFVSCFLLRKRKRAGKWLSRHEEAYIKICSSICSDQQEEKEDEAPANVHLLTDNVNDVTIQSNASPDDISETIDVPQDKRSIIAEGYFREAVKTDFPAVQIETSALHDQITFTGLPDQVVGAIDLMQSKYGVSRNHCIKIKITTTMSDLLQHNKVQDVVKDALVGANHKIDLLIDNIDNDRYLVINSDIQLQEDKSESILHECICESDVPVSDDMLGNIESDEWKEFIRIITSGDNEGLVMVNSSSDKHSLRVVSVKNVHQDVLDSIRSNMKKLEIETNEPEKEDNPDENPNDDKDDAIKVGGVTIAVEQGDLTKSDADVIVNGTSSTFSKEGAVTKNILKQGGHGIFNEWNEKTSGKMFGQELTGSGNLSCKHIIHLDTQDHRSWEDRICDTLQLAEEHKLKSVDFPAFGTGKMLHLDINEIASKMYYGIRKFSETQPKPVHVKKVQILVYDTSVVPTFRNSVLEAHGASPADEDDLSANFAEPKISDVQNPTEKQDVQPQDRGSHGNVPIILGNVTLEVKQGDITKIDTDAIINGTNRKFTEQGAVTRNILKSGGPELIEAWKQLKYNGALCGQTMTGSGDLTCRHIIHLDTQDHRSWADRVFDTLQLAEEHKLKSVAYPAFGTGTILHVDNKTICQQMYNGVKKFADTTPQFVDMVLILVYDEKLFPKFAQILSEIHAET